MKKSLVALALLGAFASAAQAQSSVTIYGTLDAGVSKTTDKTTAIGKRDNNKLGFKGVEDLGSGLKALFQLEIRYEPDTGTVENNTRPLFQGQSRVGLQGDFGTVRIGRGLTAFQESSTAFEPWNGIGSPAGFQTDLAIAAYTSDPLGVASNSKNRFSNAVFYNTPVIGGFQLNATVASKEGISGGSAVVGKGTLLLPQYAAEAQAAAVPYSLSGTYNNGPIGAMLAYERNAVETKLWSVAASFKPVPELKVMGSYQRQDEDHTKATNTKTKAWVLGANYTMGPGKLLVGYGQKNPDGAAFKTKQASVGYEYSLSKRTYIYADLSNKKAPAVAPASESVNFYGLGMHHDF